MCGRFLQVEADQRVAALLESEHTILEQLFPRHIIEHLAQRTAPWRETHEKIVTGRLEGLPSSMRKSDLSTIRKEEHVFKIT